MPEKEARMHEHPRFDPVAIRRLGEKTHVYGYKLVAGDVIQETDVYDSTAGDWQPAPCPGLMLQEGAGAVFVRPYEPGNEEEDGPEAA